MFAIVIYLVLLMCRLDHLNFCVVCINGMSVVVNVTSNKCDEPTS